MRKLRLLVLSGGLLLATVLGGCMKDKIEALKLPAQQEAQQKAIDEDFVTAMADYAVKVFQASLSDSENTMISPPSLLIALAFCANGASGATQSEMLDLLGGFEMASLNAYLASYSELLSRGELLKVANSLWISDRPDVQVLPGFLQVAADYYQAEVYQEKFSEATVKAINKWVDAKTNGLITDIIDELDPEVLICLINAIVFEAKWAEVYDLEQVHPGEFIDVNRNSKSVAFMHSKEEYYLKDDLADGFIKYYEGYKYAFVALLPSQELALNDYIAQLDGAALMNLLANKKEATVYAALPKFKYETSLKMPEILRSLGMTTAFDPQAADFSKMLDLSKRNDNVFIGDIIHKTYIQVDELGTKAGAVTAILMCGTAAPLEIYEVNLNRPFLYLIIDTESSLPIFIGSVQTIE